MEEPHGLAVFEFLYVKEYFVILVAFLELCRYLGVFGCDEYYLQIIRGIDDIHDIIHETTERLLQQLLTIVKDQHNLLILQIFAKLIPFLYPIKLLLSHEMEIEVLDPNI